MDIKHKIIKDFQYILGDKKIFILKSGAILENYIYKTKTNSIKVDSDIINFNSDYFKLIDWKNELLMFLKTNKIPQPSLVSKKLSPFIEEMFIVRSPSSDSVSIDIEKAYKIKLKNLDKRELDLESNLTKSELLLEKEYRNRLKDIIERESNLDRIQKEFEEKSKKLDIEYNDKVQKKIEEVEKTYQENSPEINQTHLAFIKELLTNLHGSLPYYQNKMDILKKRLEEIIEQFQKL